MRTRFALIPQTKFRTGHMSAPCPFCKPYKFNPIIEENNLLVVNDLYPISDGHLLIAPKRHVESFFLTTKEEKISLLAGIDQAKSLIEKDFKPDGYNIGINDGEAAGQTISHLHIHLIPRYEGDASDPRGGIRWVLPNKAPYWEINE